MLKEQWRRHKTPLRMVINSLIGIGIVLILNSSVLAETNNPKTLDSTDATDVIVVFVSGALGIVGGIVAAIFTSTQKIKELKEEFKLREKEQKREEIAKLRRDYLNPLRLSADRKSTRLNSSHSSVSRMPSSA